MSSKPKLQLTSFTGVMSKVGGTPAVPDAEIKLNLIDTERQVRTKIGDLKALTASIKALGVLEPILVMALDNGRYLLIAGERRLLAAAAAGLDAIPVLIKRGLSKLEIRQIQVTENNERENLTPYDEAMGVAEDVETFGATEAQKIWNRGEAWISKRLNVKRYAEPVAELLRDGLCGDLEVLQSLHQLYGRSKDDFEHMAKRLREGASLSRDDVRAKVAAVKDWQKKETEVPGKKGAKNLGSQWAAQDFDPPEKDAPFGKMEDLFGKSTGSTGSKSAKAGSNAGAAAAPAPKSSQKPDQKPAQNAGMQDGDSGDLDTLTGQLPGVELTPEEVADADRKEAQRRLESLRRDVFEWGSAYVDQFKVIQKRLGDLNADMNGTEWVLWSGFLSTVLPCLEGIGENKAKSFLNKLQGELKTKTPTLMWRELHPLAPGADPEVDNGPRVQVPEMPDGWRL